MTPEAKGLCAGTLGCTLVWSSGAWVPVSVLIRLMLFRLVYARSDLEPAWDPVSAAPLCLRTCMGRPTMGLHLVMLLTCSVATPPYLDEQYSSSSIGFHDFTNQEVNELLTLNLKHLGSSNKSGPNRSVHGFFWPVPFSAAICSPMSFTYFIS